MNERSRAQLQMIQAVSRLLASKGVPAWLFGGWGLDARLGCVTREHGDIEFWVERVHAARSKTALETVGAVALATQPPTESCEFTWDGVEFSTAYFDRQAEGGFSQPDGRWSDWHFPPDSFTQEVVSFAGTEVLAMSVAGMLAMKEQYPGLANGGPWRPKDIADIRTLRSLLAEQPPHSRTNSASIRPV